MVRTVDGKKGIPNLLLRNFFNLLFNLCFKSLFVKFCTFIHSISNSSFVPLARTLFKSLFLSKSLCNLESRLYFINEKLLHLNCICNMLSVRKSCSISLSFFHPSSGRIKESPKLFSTKSQSVTSSPWLFWLFYSGIRILPI